MNDLIFLHRNQNYGAFNIRKMYSIYMSRAILIASILFLFLINIPNLMNAFYGPKLIDEICDDGSRWLNNIPIEVFNRPKSLKIVQGPIRIATVKTPLNPTFIVKDNVDIKETPISNNSEVNNNTSTTEGNANTNPNNLIEGGLENGDAQYYGSSNILVINEEPVKYADVMPEYSEGQKAMFLFLKKNIRYPRIAIENNIEGTVFVQFVITAMGEITNVMAVRRIGGGCDEEAIRVIKIMPHWKPGKLKGKAIPVVFNLPIQFHLEK